MRTPRLTGECEFLLDFARDLGGDADAAWICDLLQSRGDVDALAEAIVALDDHFTEIDSDANLDALGFGHVGIALGEPALDARGTFDGIDDRAELGEHAVAHELEDPSVMECDLRLEQLL